jgi:hypothetical protein
MIPLGPNEIDLPFLERLVADRTLERRHLDFKLKLKIDKDADKKEFLADVSSFANAGGGHILIGVREEDGRAAELVGLPSDCIDKLKLRLEEVILKGIEPRILGYQIEPHDLDNGRTVLSISIPNSWVGPHMVTYKNTSRFYSRNSAGKWQLDVGEIRAAFLSAESIPERIDNFRMSRIGKIIAGETPVRLVPEGLTVILHLLPYASFHGDIRLSAQMLNNRYHEFSIFKTGEERGESRVVNLHGVAHYSISAADGRPAYTQTFYNGCVEAVVRSPGFTRESGASLIQSGPLCRMLLQAAKGCLNCLKSVDIPAPIFVGLTLSNVRGRFIHVFDGDDQPIMEEPLILPGVVMQDYESTMAPVLRPILDSMWQAAGHTQCNLYNAEGYWKHDANL